MSKITFSLASMIAACAVMSFSAHAIDKEYRKMLERSGCTQVTEAQGCDINKTKAENAKAGFGASSHAQSTPAPHYKDLAGKNSMGVTSRARPLGQATRRSWGVWGLTGQLA